jgi:hypothetical protein
MLSAAFLLFFMLISFFASLRAEPQHSIPMYDQAELTPAVITASHVALRARRTGFKASNNPRNQRISSRNVPRIQFGPVFCCESPLKLRRRVIHNEKYAACFGSWSLPRHQRRTPSNTACPWTSATHRDAAATAAHSRRNGWENFGSPSS